MTGWNQRYRCHTRFSESFETSLVVDEQFGLAIMNFSSNICLAVATLRPHRAEDRISYVSTQREPEFYRMIGIPMPSSHLIVEESETWIQKKINSIPSWAIEVDSKCIGSVRIHSIETSNRRGRFSIEIFNGDYRGRGIGTEVTEAIVRVAFEELLLHRLDLRVLTINEAAIRCYERCGFKREGVQRDTLLLDGVWYSDLWMSILEHDYRSTTTVS